MSKTTVADESETFRQLVIESKTDASVAPAAEASAGRLNAMYQKNPDQFTVEDKRWLNTLRGYLSVRLAALTGKKAFAKKPKRKGDTLEHCWRCETPVDERFVDICPTCDSKEYHWRTCPVCGACGCQRAGKVLM